LAKCFKTVFSKEAILNFAWATTSDFAQVQAPDIRVQAFVAERSTKLGPRDNLFPLSTHLFSFDELQGVKA